MAQWKRVDSTSSEFIYHLLCFSGEKTVDLDNSFLRGLVELFILAQLGFWKQINCLAQTRFPDRRVDQNEIQEVREFIQNRSDDFVRLFAEHIPHYLLLNFRPKDWDPCTQKKPHFRPNDHYADHLAVWRTPTDSYQLMVSESKASEKNARRLVKKSPPNKKPKGTMFDEFYAIETRQQDLSFKHQLLDLDWTFLTTEEEVEKLVEIGFWKKDCIYHGCVITSESKARPSIFDGYREIMAKEPDSPERRWATVVPISKWKTWVDKITTIALDFLAEREAEGHF